MGIGRGAIFVLQYQNVYVMAAPTSVFTLFCPRLGFTWTRLLKTRSIPRNLVPHFCDVEPPGLVS